jgi:hydrogenase large subunit
MAIQIDPVSRVAGLLAVRADVDAGGRFSNASASAQTFRGYENLLVGRDVRDAVFISSRACGVCGSGHAIASALALEMMFGVRPPQFGITIRNVLSALDHMADHPVQLFLQAGPDYSEPVVRATNPELWTRAETTPAEGVDTHGYKTIGDLLTHMTRFTGNLYREALMMSRTAREAFVLMGGKYPHPQTITPGGISSTIDPSDLNLALLRVVKFLDYCRKVAAVWDDVTEFFFTANDGYRSVGETPANFIDLGLWDDCEAYDATYENSAAWGERRWSTPGVVLGGRVQTTSLPDIDVGVEEFVDQSYYGDWTGQGGPLLQQDPINNPLSARHPWNKQTLPTPGSGGYSWSTSPRWRNNAMETGAGARLWITALAGRLPRRGFQDPTGRGMRFGIPSAEMPQSEREWHVPDRWNALERNRARAYGLVQSTLAAYENIVVAFDLARIGGPEAGVFTHYKVPTDHVIGCGYWGGGRGYISHHVESDSKVIRNYQILSPSTFSAGPRAAGQASPLEQAIMATPSLATQGHDRHIDVLRAIRSFDLCMSCASH